MLLYNSAVSGNCYKVRLLLAHLGLPYEIREVDVVDRSTRPELLGDLNPALRVPTLVLDDGRTLGESGAIIWYFGEGSRFVPEDRYERDPQLAALEWLVEVTGTEIGTWPVREVPVKMSATPPFMGGAIDRGGPCYGEDNECECDQEEHNHVFFLPSWPDQE